jgi:hypothetical protein
MAAVAATRIHAGPADSADVGPLAATVTHELHPGGGPELDQVAAAGSATADRTLRTVSR